MPLEKIVLLTLIVSTLLAWLIVRNNKRKKSEFLDSLSFVDTEVFETDDAEHPNYAYKTWLCVWQDAEGKQYVSSYLEFIYNGKSAKINAWNLPPASTKPIEGAKIKPWDRAIPYESRNELLSMSKDDRFPKVAPIDD